MSNTTNYTTYSPGGVQYVIVVNVIVFFIIGLGLIGNLLAFITIFKYRHKNSLEHILLVLAFADMMYLISNLAIGLMQVMHFLYSLPICDHSDELCYDILSTVLDSITGTFWRLGALVTVYLSLDRYVAIVKPLQSLRVCTPRIAKRVLGGITTFVVVYVLVEMNIWRAWKNPSKPMIHVIAGLITFILYYVIPVVLMFVFNCLLIRAICISRRTLTQLTTVEQSAASQISPTCKVIWVITVFIITHVSAFFLDEFVPVFAPIPRMLNSSVNIFIYYVISQKFRRALAAWLCFCRADPGLSSSSGSTL